MRDHARAMLLFAAAGVVVLAVASASAARAQEADPNSAPNPYRVVEHWANLPEGRVWGQAIGVDIDRDGTSIWVFDRCGARTCEGSDLAPIQKFDASGHLVASFGSGMFEWPHGLFSASDGTVWVTDGKKQIVVQLAPDGRALRTLGKPGVAGDGPDEFNSPSDVLVAPNGDIFVADGHGDFPVPKTNDRIVKYSKDGKFIKAWGRHGSGQGEFDVPHGLAMDSAGRLFVADRANNRIQIFDQDGKFLAEWKQFGRPSGVYIRDDIIYVTDSQSNEKVNPPFRQGIRIGSVRDGKVTAFISAPDPNEEMPEGVAADKQGNVFGGFTLLPDIKKYVRN
jgi:DNA-binding beta-propeller fold protein YncE